MVSYLSRIALHELTHALVFTPELISHCPRDATPPHSAEHGLGYNVDTGYYGTGVCATSRRPRACARMWPYHASPAPSSVTSAARRYVARRHGSSTERFHRASSCARSEARAFDTPCAAQLDDGGGAGTATSHWEMRTFRDGVHGRLVRALLPHILGHHRRALLGFGLVRRQHVQGRATALGPPRRLRLCDAPVRRVDHRPRLLVHGQRRARVQLRPARAGLLRADRVRRAAHPLRPAPVRPRLDQGRLLAAPRLLPRLPIVLQRRLHAQVGLLRLAAGGQERCEHCRCFEASTNSAWRSEPSCFRMRCLNTTTLEVHVGDKWHRCDPAGGAMIVLQPYRDETGGTVTCPPASELCDLDTALWPVLSSVEPSYGPAAGGIALTLHGHHLDALQPPVQVAPLPPPHPHTPTHPPPLAHPAPRSRAPPPPATPSPPAPTTPSRLTLQLLFGTAEGAETAALDLIIHNATHATATVPALIGATSHAKADVTLTDRPGAPPSFSDPSSMTRGTRRQPTRPPNRLDST
jgi:hypothetical protein